MLAIFGSIVALILTGAIIWLIFADDEKVKRILKWDDESQAAKAAASAEGAESVQEALNRPFEASAEAMAEAEKSIEAPLESAAEEVAVNFTAGHEHAEGAEVVEQTEDVLGIEASRGAEIFVDVTEEDRTVDDGSEEKLQEAVKTANLMAEEAAALSGETKIVVPTTDNFPDNLTKLNGVGEVYERYLYAAGIFTWHQIAETPSAKLAEITQAIDAANVGDWPGQARRLAADAGRTGIRYSGPMPDKLTAIPGIGPTAQQQLHEHGIITYHQLSIAPPEKVAAILGDAGKRVDIAAIIAKAKELA